MKVCLLEKVRVAEEGKASEEDTINTYELKLSPSLLVYNPCMTDRVLNVCGGGPTIKPSRPRTPTSLKSMVPICQGASGFVLFSAISCSFSTAYP